MKNPLAPLVCLVLGLVAAGHPARAGDGARELAPLCAEPRTLWSFGPFALEAAPRVADGLVLVTGRDAGGRRALIVLDAASGRLLSRTLFQAAAPLEVAVAGTHVALRTAPNTVELLGLRGARLVPARTFTHPSALSVPLLDEDGLTLREGGELAHYSFERNEAVWRGRAPGAFHGAPTLAMGALLAVWYEDDGRVHLTAIDPQSGAQRADTVLGRDPSGAAPPASDAVHVTVADGQAFVRLAQGLRTSSGATLTCVRCAFDGRGFGRASLHDFSADPIGLEDGWLARENTGGGPRWILVRRGEGGERAVELASTRHHDWLAQATTPPARAGRVLYLGSCAADAHSLEVLWRRERSPDFQPVPVDGGLLWIEGGMLLRLGSEPTSPEAQETRARGVIVGREHALAERLAQIAARALRASDGELAARLVAEAEALGASSRTLGLLASEAERVRSSLADAQVERRRGALLAEEREARAAFLEDLAGDARLERDPAVQRALLLELFARAPEAPAGLELLGRLLPPGAHVGPGEARDWVEFLGLAARRSVRPLPPAPPGGARTPEAARLEAERAEWRPDCVGYESERLLVITAGTPPDAVARALHTGELVCDALEQVFGGARASAERLEVVLYPSRDEYLAHSGTDLGGLETVLGFTAGHFDLGAKVSRLFLPAEDEGEARLLGVSAHELTHHWLATRSPFGPPRGGKTTGGFWIVEGFATWAEELRLDTERGTWHTDPARAPSLDTLVHAGPSELLAWSSVLAGTFEDYCKLETRTTANLSLDWQLGAFAPRSPMQLFYAQGGALVHYLWEAEGGAHRDTLIEVVRGFYRDAPVDVARALGASPDELGRRVVAWARTRLGPEARPR